MLRHQKLVTANLTENEVLFVKELRKSIRWLEPDDLANYRRWLEMNFGDTHGRIIRQVFDGLPDMERRWNS